MNRWMLTLAAVSCWFGLLACDPENACDSGYYADHGYCLRHVMLDASVAEDGGEIMQNPNATFGTSCTSHSDCGGEAPVCGGPLLPVCTTINCLDTGEDICPAPWTCVDVTKYMPGPGVTHTCVKL